MTKKKYSNKFDTVIAVAEKALLTEYLSSHLSKKGIELDIKKELTTDYVHELLDQLKTEDERLDIVEEAECMEDLASEFFPQIREFVLNDSVNYPLEWTDKESNETIVLRIFLRSQKAYKLVYDLFLCDKCYAKLHHYSLEADEVLFKQENIEAFKVDLKKYFEDQKQTGSCYIRQREYKGRQYILVLRGDEQKTVTVLNESGDQKVHRVFRPAKEDMVVYDKENSVIAMSPGIGSTKNKLAYANAFNKHILSGKDTIGKGFFSADNYLVDLKPLFDKKFYERTAEVEEIKLVYIFAIKDGTVPIELKIVSEDVLDSIKTLGLHISDNEIVSAKIEVRLEGRKGAIPVPLTQRSTGQINGRKESETVESFLRARKVISF